MVKIILGHFKRTHKTRTLSITVSGAKSLSISGRELSGEKLPHIRLKSLAISMIFSLAMVFAMQVNAQTIGDVGKKKVTVIKPKKEIEKADSAQIDDERFEIGAFVGSMSIQEFNTVLLGGISGHFHINSRFMVGLRYGQTDSAKALAESFFEEGVNFIPDRDEGFRYLALEGSIKISESRSYLGSRRKFSSRLYFDLGIENIEFAGNDELGLSLGLNYKIVLTDWLTGNLVFKDHIFNNEFLGEEELTQNLEFSIGFNALF